MINFAVIGTSKITGEFVSAANLTGRYCLKAVYSRTEEKGRAFANKFNCNTVYTSLVDLANDKTVNAVYVASPNALHFKQSKFLLENGKHVICEKTITQSPEEFSTLKKTADDNNLIIMDAIMSRYAASRDSIKSAIAEIGDIAQARIDFSKLSARYFDYLKGENVNIFNMALGAGALMDIGVYCVYAAVDLLGMPESISAVASFLPDGADSGGVALFRYNNFDAVLTYGKTAETAIGSEILGTKGTVKIGKISQYLDAQLIKNGKGRPLSFAANKIDVMQGEANAFADYVENFSASKDKYAASSQLTYNVLLCIEQIKKSASIVYPDYM